MIENRTGGSPIATERTTGYELDVVEERFAVVRLDAGAPEPAWTGSSSFVSVTRTPTELSVVCEEEALPPSADARRGLRCLVVRGPLAFDEIGVLESLARPLAAEGVSIFVVSTYDTDYLFVDDDAVDRAVGVLREAGHTLVGVGG